MADDGLRIEHDHGQNKTAMTAENKLNAIEMDDAIQALQLKMASYPLPTAEVGEMAPPKPPAVSGKPVTQAAKANAPTDNTPKKPAQAQKAEVSKAANSVQNSPDVVAEAPNEIKIIH